MSVFALDLARPDDKPALDALIAASARMLCDGYYDEAATEAAITHVFGVDSQLVEAGCYFVARLNGDLVGCGGWSPFATLFGADQAAGRDDRCLDPAVDAARIRAFFVAPDCARHGVGTALLRASEEAAARAGFRKLALMATLSGVPFYAAHGYAADAAQDFDFEGVPVRFAPMHKALAPATSTAPSSQISKRKKAGVGAGDGERLLRRQGWNHQKGARK